jgi:hypothetical protein
VIRKQYGAGQLNGRFQWSSGQGNFKGFEYQAGVNQSSDRGNHLVKKLVCCLRNHEIVGTALLQHGFVLCSAVLGSRASKANKSCAYTYFCNVCYLSFVRLTCAFVFLLRWPGLFCASGTAPLTFSPLASNLGVMLKTRWFSNENRTTILRSSSEAEARPSIFAELLHAYCAMFSEDQRVPRFLSNSSAQHVHATFIARPTEPATLHTASPQPKVCRRLPSYQFSQVLLRWHSDEISCCSTNPCYERLQSVLICGQLPALLALLL